jgi:glycosyltransferase involved in cell wall biosynthesis
MTTKSTTTHDTKTKVMLNMIIKNESKTIERCLESVKDWVDGICICDTGSTDETLAILETWKKDHNMQNFFVKSEPWVNFGHNRTLAIDFAQSVIPIEERQDWYLLFLDADMELTLQKEEEKDEKKSKWDDFKQQMLPTFDIWYTLQKLHTLSYTNIRWVRASMKVESKGPTHEYYDILTKEATISTTPDWLIIEDRGDGGSKQDKFKRDVQLLKKALEKEPSNSRNWFYLANSYRDLGENDQACRAYTQRLKLGGWKEEMYMSLIYLGDTLCRFKELSYDVQAIKAWLDAFDIQPNRVEALYRLCRYYRIQKRYQLAKLFYDKGMEISSSPSFHNFTTFSLFPLFYEHDIDKYLWKFELSIFAYYLNDENEKQKGRKACQELLELHATYPIPKNIIGHVHENLKLYASD